MKNLLFVFILSLILFFLPAFAQEHQESEITSSVPELFAFHDVIYQIWHTGYPEKDFELLKSLVPEVKEGADKVLSAKLPGILRDKQTEWDKGLTKFKSSVEKYNKAMEGNDEQEILSSAEELHSDFEMLVRIIKPVTKEVDEFHKVLYMIYHHYGPGKQTEELNNAIDDLAFRAAELKNCVLPKWAENKKEDFMKTVDELYTSTTELKALKDSNAGEEKINNAIEKVHSDYQSLEALFD